MILLISILSKPLKRLIIFAFCWGMVSPVFGQSKTSLPKDWPKDVVPASIWFDIKKSNGRDYRELLKKVGKYRNTKEPYIQYIYGFLACNLQLDGIPYLEKAESNARSSLELMQKAKNLMKKCGTFTDWALYEPSTNKFNSKGINSTSVAGVTSDIKGGGFRRAPIGEETYIKDLGKWNVGMYEKLNKDSLIKLYFKQDILNRYQRTEKGKLVFYKYKNENERLITESLDSNEIFNNSDSNITQIITDYSDPNNGGTNPNNGGTQPTGAGQGINPVTIDTLEIHSSNNIVIPDKSSKINKKSRQNTIGRKDSKPLQETPVYIGSKQYFVSDTADYVFFERGLRIPGTIIYLFSCDTCSVQQKNNILRHRQSIKDSLRFIVRAYANAKASLDNASRMGDSLKQIIFNYESKIIELEAGGSESNNYFKKKYSSREDSLMANDDGDWFYGPQGTTGLALGTGGRSAADNIATQNGNKSLLEEYNAAEIEYVLVNHLKFLETLFDTIYTGDRIRVFMEFSSGMLRYNALRRDSLKLPWDIAGYTHHLFNSINADVFSGTGTFTHELTHLFIKWAYPDASPWLNEGLACLYEEFIFENSPEANTTMSIGKSNWREKYLPNEYKLSESLFIKYKPKVISKILETGNIEFHCIDTLGAKVQALNYALARRICSYLQDKNMLKAFIIESKNSSIEEQGKSKEYFAELLLKILKLKTINDLECKFLSC